MYGAGLADRADLFQIEAATGGSPVTVMTRKRRALLDQLIAVAGDPTIVEQALRSLNEEASEPPDMRAIVRRILEIRKQRNELVHAGAQ